LASKASEICTPERLEKIFVELRNITPLKGGEESHLSRTVDFYARDGNRQFLFPAAMDVKSCASWETRPRTTNAEECVHKGDVRLARL